MEIDEPKARQCRADKRLEKPFDADTLRQLVKDLVPSLGSNLISNFLSFPEMPEMVEENAGPMAPPPAEGPSIPSAPARLTPKATPQMVVSDEDEFPADDSENDEIQLVDFDRTRVGNAKEMPPKSSPSNSDNLNFPDLEEIEEPEEFQSIPLPKNQGLPPPPKPKAPQDDWARQDLSRYRIELPKDDPYPIDDADLTNSSIALSSGVEEITLDRIDELDGMNDLTSSGARSQVHPSRPSKPAANPASKSYSSHTEMPAAVMSSLDPMHAEEVLRQEARAVLENVAWKLLPEIVERVVREELQKLLKDAERL